MATEVWLDDGPTIQEQVREAVRPFADLMDGPHSVLPTQARFDALAELYNAHPHADFRLPEGHEQWASEADTGYYANLPFRLALGLHRAARQSPDIDALRETFRVYAATKPLFAVEGGPSMERRIRRERAQSVLSGAVITAAIQTGAHSRSRVNTALEVIKAEELMGWQQFHLLKRSVKLVTTNS
ncbi:MAG TPA: hypothetical protein VG992_00485 [Candidatus Saccharimonadales bacterium]|nr:hypothetical protein [Candidatus Saccharimonadales bacterium]